MAERNQSWLLVVPVLAVVLLAAGIAWWLSATREHGQEKTGAAAMETFTNSIGMEFVAIPGGRFTMGGEPGSSPANELPPHTVQVAPFYLGKYEVTQAQFEAVMGYNPSAFINPQRPVDQVTWLEVQSFVEALNRAESTPRYRLPSEAEWEYAARAGSDTPWFFGADSTPLNRFAWYGKGGDVGTRPVGRAAANPWGLYDIYGNVWEWVQDCWHDSYAAAPAQGGVWSGGDCGSRMLRGGGWNSPAEFARSAVRGSYAPHLNDAANGFRLARSR